MSSPETSATSTEHQPVSIVEHDLEFLHDVYHDGFVPTIDELTNANGVVERMPRDADGRILNEYGRPVDEDLALDLQERIHPASWRLDKDARKSAREVMAMTDETELTGTQADAYTSYHSMMDGQGLPATFQGYQRYVEKWLALDQGLYEREKAAKPTGNTTPDPSAEGAAGTTAATETQPVRMTSRDRKEAKSILRGKEGRLTPDQKQKFEAWQQAEKAEGRTGDFDSYREHTRQGLQQDDELIRSEEAQRVRGEKQDTKRVLHIAESDGTNAHTGNTTSSSTKSAENSTASKTTSSTGAATSTAGGSTTHNTRTAATGDKTTDNDTRKNNSKNRSGKDREPQIDMAKMQAIHDLGAQYDEIRAKSRHPDMQALSAIDKQLNELYATLTPEETDLYSRIKKEAQTDAKKQSKKELDDYLAIIRRDKQSLSQLAASGYKWKLPEAELKEKERLAKEAQLKQMLGEIHTEGRTKRVARASGRLAMRSMFATGRGVKKVTYKPAVSTAHAVAAKRQEVKDARFERQADARERAFQAQEMYWETLAPRAKARNDEVLAAEARAALERQRKADEAAGKRAVFVGGADGIEYRTADNS